MSWTPLNFCSNRWCCIRSSSEHALPLSPESSAQFDSPPPSSLQLLSLITFKATLSTQNTSNPQNKRERTINLKIWSTQVCWSIWSRHPIIYSDLKVVFKEMKFCILCHITGLLTKKSNMVNYIYALKLELVLQESGFALMRKVSMDRIY